MILWECILRDEIEEQVLLHQETLVDACGGIMPQVASRIVLVQAGTESFHEGKTQSASEVQLTYQSPEVGSCGGGDQCAFGHSKS